MRGRDDDLLAHAAVGVDAQNLKLRTAIGLPGATGDAHAAVEIRLHRAQIADLDPCRLCVRPERDDLHPQFMAQDAGIAEKRLPSPECVEIGAADADPAHGNQRFARAGRSGRGRFG